MERFAIIGGVGPHAHVFFEQCLLNEYKQRGVNRDQDYPEYLLVSATSLPDRTESLKSKAGVNLFEKAFGELIERLSVHSGLEFFVVPCMTAHAFYPALHSTLRLRWLSVFEVLKPVVTELPADAKVAIISTTGTLKQRIFQTMLSEAGRHCVSFENDPDKQEGLHDVVYSEGEGIKSLGTSFSPKLKDRLRALCKDLEVQGATHIIPGCTEFSVAFAAERFSSCEVLDPLQIVASEIYERLQ